MLWVRAAVRLVPLRPRAVGAGVPSWRQLRHRPSLRQQGCGPLPRWRARSLDARPGPCGPSAPCFPALNHTEAGSSSRGCLGAPREGAGLATRCRLCGPPLCRWTARPASSRSWELREVLRVRGAGRLAAPAVTRSAPRQQLRLRWAKLLSSSWEGLQIVNKSLNKTLRRSEVLPKKTGRGDRVIGVIQLSTRWSRPCKDRGRTPSRFSRYGGGPKVGMWRGAR